LKAIEWMIAPPKFDATKLPGLHYVDLDTQDLPTFLWPEESFMDGDWQEPKAAKAVNGLRGLVVLGDAWQSVHLLNTLAKAVLRDNQRTSVSYLALLRAAELASQNWKHF
jgi:hypothetical protein